MGVPRSASVSVDLVRVLELLRTHITAALCQTVFATTRITERQREWTLEALVQFWLAGKGDPASYVSYLLSPSSRSHRRASVAPRRAAL